MQIVKLQDWKEAATPEIQERARNGSACQLTRKYSAYEDGCEVAYLALDWWPLHQRSDLVLYEMFVLPKVRHRGIGTRILAAVERLASDAGYQRVVLIARPLENYPKKQLREWYQRQGFKAFKQGGPDAMAKSVKEMSAIESATERAATS